jgi:hypothetical protein
MTPRQWKLFVKFMLLVLEHIGGKYSPARNVFLADESAALSIGLGKELE